MKKYRGWLREAESINKDMALIGRRLDSLKKRVLKEYQKIKEAKKHGKRKPKKHQ